MPEPPVFRTSFGALSCPREHFTAPRNRSARAEPSSNLESRAGDKRKLESECSSSGSSSEENSDEDEDEDEDESSEDESSDDDVVEVVRTAVGGSSSLQSLWQHGGCQSGASEEPGTDARAVVEAELASSCPRLQRLTVVQLQGYLRAVGLRISGLKAELIDRVQQHYNLHAGDPSTDRRDFLASYPESSFTVDCTGDVCKGDTVLFNQAVFSSFDPVTRKSTVQGYRKVAGRVIKESYGEEKQQHTFSIEVLWSRGTEARCSLEVLLVKGRNLYRMCGGFGARRQPWADESLRHAALQEKHRRGQEARAKRRRRKAGKGGAGKQGRGAKRRRTDASSHKLMSTAAGAQRPLATLGQGHTAAADPHQLGSQGAGMHPQGAHLMLLPLRGAAQPWPAGTMPQAQPRPQYHPAGLLQGHRLPLQSLQLAMAQPQVPYLKQFKTSCTQQAAGFGFLAMPSHGEGRDALNRGGRGGRPTGEQAAAGPGHTQPAASGGCHAAAGKRACRCGSTAAWACPHALCAFCCSGDGCPRHASISLPRGNRKSKPVR